MNLKVIIRNLGGFFLAGLASSGLQAGAVLNTADASNGITSIYSATFDGATTPCGGGSSTYCTFFGGDPPGTLTLTVAPNPTGIVKAVPGGIGPTGIPPAAAPGAGSWLDLTLGGGNTTLTLNRGTVTLADVNIQRGAGGVDLNVNAHLAGFVIADPGAAIGGALTPAGGGSTGKTVPVVGTTAVFEIQQAAAIQIDFSKFSQVVTSCTGTFCGLVTSDTLFLDMVRYVLVITYNPTFTSFTGTLIGQSSNNSIVFANLNSIDVAATDTDGDGWPDAVDNCTLVANPTQLDANGDGFGNICDADLNNSGLTTATDFNLLKSVLNQSASSSALAAAADMNGSGTVTATDFNLLKARLNTAPGPSGLP